MAQNRIFHAVHAVGLAGENSTNFTVIHGLQSVGITTTFNLEQVFEIGQLDIYENIEGVADVEMTLEKVLDGYPLIYHLATQDGTTNTISGRSEAKAQAALSIFDDSNDSASGTPLAEVQLSGLFVSSVGYNIPVDGNSTESVTLVGNNKIWKGANFDFSGTLFDNTDEPLALTSGTGGVQRRENVVFDSSIVDRDSNNQVKPTTANPVTILPREIPGISSSGTNDKDADGNRKATIQSISVNADLGRDEIFELGTKVPFFRFVNFPVEVTTSIEVHSKSGDFISATEAGTQGGGDNLRNESIYIGLDDSTLISVGDKNKLTSVSYDGGSADGGNVSTTYDYQTFNTLSVSHDQNPGPNEFHN